MISLSSDGKEPGSGENPTRLASRATLPLQGRDKPLTGRTVAIVHPAWHSCGTYSVVLGQIEAYRTLGADVVTVANSDFPGFGTSGPLARRYAADTPELDAQPRFFAGVPAWKALSPRFVQDAIIPFLHGDQAAMRAGASAASDLSAGLAGLLPDLVHCNHFFCMPVARRLAGESLHGSPLVMDTHDLQAAQFDIINDARPILPPRATRDAMLARELAEMRGARALLHLNADEARNFHALLPDAPHHLLYPPVPDVPTGPGGPDILVVSSWNAANLESMLWFLREVMPRAGDPPLRIAGNVDAGVRSADRALYERHKSLFVGRVDDLGALYAGARLVLLPTVAGTGLSIKTVEAMASGLPLIASPLAFRGMDFDPAPLGNVTLAADAEAFAAALRQATALPIVPDASGRAASPTRNVYETTFSAKAYAARLAAIVMPLLAPKAT